MRSKTRQRRWQASLAVRRKAQGNAHLTENTEKIKREIFSHLIFECYISRIIIEMANYLLTYLSISLV